MISQEALSSTIGCKVNFDVRILYQSKKVVNLEKGKPLYFQIVNYDGLVGNYYNMRNMLYDDCLAQNNSSFYHLGNYQIGKTRDLEFSIVCPLFNSSDDVVAIAAIDGKQKIDISAHKSEITNNVLTFSHSKNRKI